MTNNDKDNATVVQIGYYCSAISALIVGMTQDSLPVKGLSVMVGGLSILGVMSYRELQSLKRDSVRPKDSSAFQDSESDAKNK